MTARTFINQIIMYYLIVKFQRRKEILQQTRVSLEHIQKYYEEQRQRIEAELDKRKKSKEEDKENLSPISHSTSSSSEFASTSSSTKESSIEDEKFGKRTAQIRRTASHSVTHRQLTLNKSR